MSDESGATIRLILLPVCMHAHITMIHLRMVKLILRMHMIIARDMIGETKLSHNNNNDSNSSNNIYSMNSCNKNMEY